MNDNDNVVGLLLIILGCAIFIYGGFVCSGFLSLRHATHLQYKPTKIDNDRSKTAVGIQAMLVNTTSCNARDAAFNTVANLLAAIDDSDLRQLLADSIVEYGSACAQQVLDSWIRSINNLRPQAEPN